MNRIAGASCWLAFLATLLSGGSGCQSDQPADYHYDSDLLARESIQPETNSNWQDHARFREEQAKWERDRTYYDFDYRRHHRDGW